MANSVREFVIESLRGFYERLPLKKVAVDGSVLTPNIYGVVNVPVRGDMTYITYAELKNLRDTSSLLPGMQYRITDYHCSTTQQDTSTADNQFDIIVTADSSTVLNENARAAKHTDSSTDYFAKCNLEAWELKYCLDNDKERFAWADEEDGTGVIFYMKDEWNNECPYDFKNIMFLRGQDWRDEHPDISQEIFGDCEEEYFYTFSCYDTENLQLGDATLKNCDGVIHDTEECSCFCNTIKILRGPSGADQDSGNLPAYLNNIVFFNTYETDVYYTCFSNVFETDCFNNTFGDGCHTNSFGSDCYSNTFVGGYHHNSFGNGCHSNTFGSGYYNSFGNYCYSNTFGNRCSYNSFGNYCYSNTFGNDCGSNSFGNYCYSNTFGNDCGSNSFRNGCFSNTFGNNCNSNSFGNKCYYIKFGNSSSVKSYYQYIIVENGNRNIYLDTTQTTSSGKWIQNIKIAQGVNNINTNTWKTITHNTVNDTFQTVYQPANSNVIEI